MGHSRRPERTGARSTRRPRDLEVPLLRIPSARVLLVVPLLFAALLVLGAAIGPSGSTETRYCTMAREMLRSGDFVVPTLNHAPLLEKPPFEYWGTAISMAVAGVNVVAARLPHLLAGLLTILVAATVARRFSPEPSTARARALLAALALGTTPSFLVQNYMIAPDAWLLLCTTTAGWALLEADRVPGRTPWRWALLLQGALGVGMLVKGPLALGLVAGAAVATALVRRRAHVLRPFANPLGWILFVAIILPWHLALEARLPGILETLVRRRLFGGLGSSADFHSHGLHTVWGPMIGALPWLGTLPGAISLLVRGGRFRHGPGLPAVMLALAAPLLFTFSASRLPSYGSPAYPWIAILFALGAPLATEDAAPGGFFSVRGALTRGAVGFGLVAVLFVAAAPFVVSVPASTFVLAGACALAALAAGLLPRLAVVAAAPVGRAAVATALFCVTAGIVLAAVPEKAGVSVALGKTLVERRAPEEPFAVLLNYNGDWGVIPWCTDEETIFFAYPSAPMIVAPEVHRPDLYRPREALLPWLREPGRRWLFLRPRDRARIEAEGVPLTVVDRAHQYELVTTVPLAPRGP